MKKFFGKFNADGTDVVVLVFDFGRDLLAELGKVIAFEKYGDFGHGFGKAEKGALGDDFLV